MTPYFLKTIACSAFLLAAYLLLLAREKMYTFNRLYLLLGIASSFIIPLFTIHTTAPQILAAPQQILYKAIPANIAHGQQAAITSTPVNILAVTTWCIYAVVTSALLLRFLLNILRLKKLSNNSNSIFYKGARLVLIEAPITPFSFLNNIYVHKQAYNNQQLEPELLTHELVHVKQKHSWDVLFIELLQTFIWFNPCIYFYKKAIQLNHELLADETVIREYNNVYYYQTLLLDKIEQNNHTQFASSFNYLITKKRLTMMTKNPNRGRAMLLKIATLPLLVCAVLAFSTRVQSQTIAKPAKTPARQLKKEAAQNDVLEEYESEIKKAKAHKVKTKKGETQILFVGGDDPAVFNHLDNLYQRMSPEQRSKATKVFDIPALPPPAKVSPAADEFTKWGNPTLYGVWADGKRLKNSELAQLNPADFVYFTASLLTEKAKLNDKFNVQIDMMTLPYYNTVYKRAIEQNK
jgi:bla regulator protein BlaR1